MIKHVVSVSFKDDVAEDEKRTIFKALAALFSEFDFLRKWTIQRNISSHDGTFEYVIALDFDTAEDLEKYFSSDKHLTFAKGVIRPRLNRRAVISFTDEAGYQEGQH